MGKKASLLSVQEGLGATEFSAKVEGSTGPVTSAHQLPMDHAPSAPRVASPFILLPPRPVGGAIGAASNEDHNSIPPALESLASNVSTHERRDKFVEGPIHTLNPTYRTKPLQQWEGTVLDVRDGGFEAILRDLTAPQRADERAAFSFDEISGEDRRLVARGAVFYWFVGYEMTPSGQRKLVSALRFRRLPAWTRSEIAAVEQEANELAAFFGVLEATKDPADS